MHAGMNAKNKTKTQHNQKQKKKNKHKYTRRQKRKATMPIAKEAPTNNHGAEYFGDYSEGQVRMSDHLGEMPVRYAKKGAASEEGCEALTLCEILDKATEMNGDSPFWRYEDVPKYNPKVPVPPPQQRENWVTKTHKMFNDDVK